MFQHKHAAYILTGISVLLNGILIVFILVSFKSGSLKFFEKKIVKESTVSSEDYPYLSSRIFQENRKDVIMNFVPLREMLRAYSENQKETIGLYFEYLPSGSSIGINSISELEMASLVKLPTAMSIYDKIARGELSFDTLLTMKEEDIDKGFGDFWKEGVGARISVRDAINKSLVDSDNTAHQMLYHVLNIRDQEVLFENSDIRTELRDSVLIPFISPKSYASILKSLYFGSYLSLADSNEVLQILANRDVREGIALGIGEDIPVAQKSGIIHSEKENVDIHNSCGIVYYPKRPYILCILVQAKDRDMAMKQIGMLSKYVYVYIRDISKHASPIPSN